MDSTLLKQLSECPGVSGREDAVRAIVRDAFEPVCEAVTTDVMGNVIGRKSGGGPRLMIAAHMDEIGFLVKFIDDNGFLRLQAIGGLDARQLFAQRVAVHPAEGNPLPGILSYTTKPTHMLTPEEARQPPKIENFFVDTGLPAEEVRRRVEIGDMVTLDRSCIECGRMVTGKAMDNRVGVFVMIEAVRALGTHDIDLYAVATSQEEVGLRGARAAAFEIAPNIGIALDTTLANDFPGQTPEDAVTRLGEGVGIKIMDSALICNPRLVDHIRRIAEREDIPHQMEILPRGGTDGGSLQQARSGAASITLSVPTRYIHTVNEMVHRDDVEAAIRLLTVYLQEAHEGDYHL